jgi:photosystem II stability/assembly factor-like uncharacterized protein
MIRLKLFFLFLTAISINATAQWQPTNGPYGANIRCLSKNGIDVFAGTSNGGIYFSDNSGASWSKRNTGLGAYTVYSILINGSELFAGASTGLYKSIDYGITWNQAGTGFPSGTSIALCMALQGSIVLAGTNGQGIYRSTDNGLTWNLSNSGLPTNPYVQGLTSMGNKIIAGLYGGGIYVSNDSGSTWTSHYISSTTVYTFTKSGNKLYASTSGTVYVSLDTGSTWSILGSGLPLSPYFSVSANGTDLFAGDYNGKVYFYNGSTWALANSGIKQAGNNTNVWALCTLGSVVLAGTNGGLYSSNNNGTSWLPSETGLVNSSVQLIRSSGSMTVAATSNSGAFITNDDGNSWTKITNGFVNNGITGIGIFGSKIFATSYNNGSYFTTDSGSTWTIMPDLPASSGGSDFLESGSDLFAAASSGVYRSSDSGLTWINTSAGIAGNVFSLTSNSSGLFAGAPSGIFASTNNGATWDSINTGLPYYPIVLSVKAFDSVMYAGAYYGKVFKSNNNGLNWDSINSGIPSDATVFDIVATENMLFVGMNKYGIFYSDNGGLSWSADNAGFPPNIGIASLMIKGAYVYAGTSGNGLWRRPLSDFVGIEHHQFATKKIVAHPNPFHSTTILRSDENIINGKLFLYNIIGEEVKILDRINGSTIIIDRAGLKNGIYFYRLYQNDSFLSKGKLIIE